MSLASLEVAADHPAFCGHFPDFPVFPGALLLDEALERIRIERGIDLTQWQVTSVKFLAPVRPGDRVTLEHQAAARAQIRFTARAGDKIVAIGVLSGAGAMAPAAP